MAVKVVWDNDAHTILRLEFFGRWMWDELNDALSRASAMMDEQECERVDVIADLNQIIGVPPLFLPHVRNILQQLDERVNISVLVGMNDLVRIIWGVVSQTYGLLGHQKRYFIARTVDDARQLIARKAELAQKSA